MQILDNSIEQFAIHRSFLHANIYIRAECNLVGLLDVGLKDVSSFQ